jgi:hypothetical protein
MTYLTLFVLTELYCPQKGCMKERKQKSNINFLYRLQQLDSANLAQERGVMSLFSSATKSIIQTCYHGKIWKSRLLKYHLKKEYLLNSQLTLEKMEIKINRIPYENGCLLNSQFS